MHTITHSLWSVNEMAQYMQEKPLCESELVEGSICCTCVYIV